MKNPSETTSNTAQGFAWSFRTISPCLMRSAAHVCGVPERKHARQRAAARAYQAATRYSRYILTANWR